MRDWPKITFRETSMQEGMQIESVDISVDDKVALIDALSQTGLRHIVVGSFVSAKWTPQMAKIDEIVKKFTPNPAVKYSALFLNSKGLERARQYSPPLDLQENEVPCLYWHLCDVFARRNTNKSQMDEIASSSTVVSLAIEQNVEEAAIGIGAAWGSNFLGEFSLETQMKFLGMQHKLWENAGINVVGCRLTDVMSFASPCRVEETIALIKKNWSNIHNFMLHFHNARNMSLACIYAAMRALGPDDTLALDGSIGGIGGCPYCGNGQASGTTPTEDVIHMLEGMGIDTGVNINRLIDCAWMAEEIIGRPLYGHVSKAGPRPNSLKELYDINMPFVETMEQARHFKLGPAAYEGGVYPYCKSIVSPYRDRIERGLSAYDSSEGDFPWKKPFLRHLSVT